MLRLIRDGLGIMNLHVRHGCVLLVEDDKRKFKRIMAIVDKYGLILTSKKRQYRLFRYCLENEIKYTEYAHLKSNAPEAGGET